MESATLSDLVPSRREINRNINKQLKLLTHNWSCRLIAGLCEYPECGVFKSLYDHMLYCHNDKCSISFCKDARRAWAHFNECDDDGCEACERVKGTIRSAHKKPSYAVGKPSNTGRVITGRSSKSCRIYNPDPRASKYTRQRELYKEKKS
jgi:hypothetical protein